MSAEHRHHTLEDLIDELARVLNDPDAARDLVLRAGFPPADVPVFGTARVFWSRVLRAAADGKTLGGIGAIVKQVQAAYPGNPFFAAYRSTTAVDAEATTAPLASMIDNRNATIGQQFVVHGDATFDSMTVSPPASGKPPRVSGEGPPSDVDLAASRRQAQLQRLDEQRLPIVRELYKRLVEARLCLSPVLLPNQSLDGRDPEAVSAARQAHRSANEYFLMHNVLLPQAAAAHVGRALSAMDRILYHLGKPRTMGDRDTRFDAIQFGYTELSKILDVVGTELRVLLGVELPNANP